MQNTYVVFFQNIQNEINNEQDNYSSSSNLICIIIEIAGFLANIIMLSLCMRYLITSNNNIYKDIANLFIDLTQDEAYTFKNNRDNYIILEKLLKLKFLINNFSVMAIDKFNKKITNVSASIIDDNKIDKSFVSKESKDNTIGKKITNEKEKEKTKRKKRHHINTSDTLNNTNTNTNNNITNNSLLNTKTQNKLLNTNSINVISKLNQNIYNDKSKISNNSLIQDSSIQNLGINKKQEEENDILTSDNIDEKIKTININLIRLNLWILLLLMVILLIYTVVKIIMNTNYIQKTQQVFIDYSIVTFEYSMIMNYFNNLGLILINKEFGREDVLDQMQTKIEAQFKKSEEVKKKSIAQYPNVYKLFSVLNNEEDKEQLKNELCKTEKNCLQIFDTNYNIAKSGIDVGLKTVSQIIYNTYKDYLEIKDEIDNIEKVKSYFMTTKF
jgi:hypothetical protein